MVRKLALATAEPARIQLNPSDHLDRPGQNDLQVGVHPNMQSPTRHIHPDVATRDTATVHRSGGDGT